ncbi:MAG: adenylate/guanylate cyclase domain-containing protein [Actinomycetota bacterium]
MEDSRTETVTFLFTDVEGSTRLLESLGEGHDILTDQGGIIRQAVADYGGSQISAEGDSLFAVFGDAVAGTQAAAQAQRSLAAFPWPGGTSVRVRMGLHTGTATRRGNVYRGLDVHRAARIAAAAHGGQIVLSEPTRSLAVGSLPKGTRLRDLGEHRLKDLTRSEHLYQLVVDGLVSDFPPLVTLKAVPNNLPVQLTSFIGRPEVDTVNDLLSLARLVTLTGPGGSGKTRLSLQVAGEAAHQFRHGAWFIALESVTDPELVPSAFATALRITHRHGSPTESLRHYLPDKEILLVIDNFEQVLAAAPLLADLLRDFPLLKMLVTSRAPLHIYGEREYPVLPLKVPDPQSLPAPEELAGYEAVALFVDRASAARADFELTPENAGAVAAITSRLEGLPLAIELAAARIRIMSPQTIAERLGNPLDLLTGGARDLPRRQRTLRDAISWSYELLNDESKAVFVRMGVFRGGAFLEQAERVCGEAEDTVVDDLESLIDQSLIQRDEPFGLTRLRLLDTIREFAWERLAVTGETEAIRQRHAEAYLEVAQAVEPHLLGRDQARWLDRLQLDHHNLRTAFDWGIEANDPNLCLGLAGTLWRFWQFRGHLDEAAERVRSALSLVGGADRRRAKAYEAAGGIAYWRGDMVEAETMYRTCLDLVGKLDDRTAEANARYNLSFSLASDSIERIELRQEALAVYQSLNDQSGIAKALWSLGSLFSGAGDLSEARRLLHESLALFRKLDEPFGIGWCLYSLASTEFLDGNVPATLAYLQEGLALFHEVGDLSAIVLFLDYLALVAWHRRCSDRALRLAGAASRLGERGGFGLIDPEFDLPEIEPLRTAMLQAASAQPDLVAAGAAMSPDDAVGYAQSDDWPAPPDLMAQASAAEGHPGYGDDH